MKRTTLIALAATAALVLGGGYWMMQRAAVPNGKSAASAAEAGAPAGKPALTVQVVHATRGTVPLTLGASGNIAAWQEAIVGSQSNGLRLAELRANVGDWVKKGQVLAVFAADTVDADVLQARAALLEAEAQAADARSNAERARSIAGTGALSTQQINQFRTAEKATAARVQAARAALSSQRLRQGFTRVLAPDSGVISSRSATVGAVVPAGTELFRLVRQGRLEWRAEVVGQDLARIRSGQRVQVTSNAGTVVEGTVRSVAPTLDPAKRVALVYVDLPGGTDNGGLKAGMYASGQFILGEVDGWLVPQTAVVSRDGFNYVFAVASQGKVLQRKVTLGAREGELVQVLEGVDGELPLVQSGAGFLNDGDLVRVTQAAPVTAASAAAPAVSAARAPGTGTGTGAAAGAVAAEPASAAPAANTSPR